MTSYPSTSSEVDKLIPLLIKVRKKIDPIGKDNGPNGKARFKYANIEKIIEAIVPLLLEHGLFLTFNEIKFDDGIFALETKIFECSGQFIRTLARVNDPLYFADPQKTAEQIYGGVLTYCKRYGMSNLLALEIGEKDPDDFKVSKKQPKKDLAGDISDVQIAKINELLDKNPELGDIFSKEIDECGSYTKQQAFDFIGKMFDQIKKL